MFSGVFSFVSTSAENIDQFLSLGASYLISCLFAYDYLQKPNFDKRYITLGVFLLTYFWQVNYLEITNPQAYSLPLGIYFLLLGYWELLQNKPDNANLLDTIGFFCILFTTTIQAFDPQTPTYALLLGSYGIIIIFTYNLWKRKTFFYAGITSIVLAVFSQTKDYLLNMPRWLIVGFTGIAFITIAVYLLLTRKETSKDTKANHQS